MTLYTWLTIGFIAACIVMLIVGVVTFIRNKRK